MTLNVGTEWSLIARCSASHDLRYQCSGDQLTPISYLQHLAGYKRQLPHIYDSINPTDSHRSYPGLFRLVCDHLLSLNQFARCTLNALMAAFKPQSNGPLYNNTVIGTMAVGGWAVTFGTARSGLKYGPLLFAFRYYYDILLLSRSSRQRDCGFTHRWCPSVCPFVCLSPKCKKTRFSQKLSNLELWYLLTTDMKLCKLNWAFWKNPLLDP